MADRKVLHQFAYRRSPDQDRPGAKPAHHPIIVVGAGPVGLSLAIDLAQRGQPIVLLDDADRIGEGSRAICFAKKTLEIWDRLGIGQRAVDKGVTWQRGRVFRGADEIYAFDLLPESGHKRPAFINLQQYYAEQFLVERATALPLIDLRWRNRVVAVERRQDGARIAIATPEGPYTLTCDWLAACDGARSSIRSLLGLDFAGETFQDQFLIADIRVDADLPVERRFWFDPPFHDGQSALLHKQPDSTWRIDLQLPPNADAEQEKHQDRVIPRIARMFGHTNFTVEWLSIYRFQCRRIARFIHDRVVFLGDAAHQVSPFGARGANSGVQDAENFAWKLDLVLRGEAPAALLETYESERIQAADENIGHSTRSTDFIAPHSPAEARLRDAVLALAAHADFAKSFVNSGRLSVATAYSDSPLSTADAENWHGKGVAPGATMLDAPLIDETGRATWLTDAVPARFALICYGANAELFAPPNVVPISVQPNDGDQQGYRDSEGLFAKRYAAGPASAYLLRPDGHVAARWHAPTRASVAAALQKARAA